RGRKQVLNALNQWKNGLVAQPLFETIERLEENVKGIEEQLRALTAGDRMVELLMSIPGCGEIGAWTIRAYTDDIKRFSSAKKYCAYAGLAPWVQNSNETIHHGKITKRGPKELRTALVQVVMGLRRMKDKTSSLRLMQRYEAMRKNKIPGKVIIATARKVATMIWHMLSEDAEFDIGKMVDQKLMKKAEAMSNSVGLATNALIEHQEKPITPKIGGTREKTPGIAREKRKKVG
ncbi:MAG: transposase, partial [Treponema sp.]|nr:transposase [Treponema sp.]